MMGVSPPPSHDWSFSAGGVSELAESSSDLLEIRSSSACTSVSPSLEPAEPQHSHIRTVSQLQNQHAHIRPYMCLCRYACTHTCVCVCVCV